MKHHTMKRLIALLLAVVIFAAALPVNAQTPAELTADTPWPMYQHDPQHTGRSPYTGPIEPELLWTYSIPNEYGSPSPITITKDGHLLFTIQGFLHKFDPVSRQVEWMTDFNGHTGGSVLIDKDDQYYWGTAINFFKVASNGNIDWGAVLDPNWIFQSSATFGLDGNLYFAHDGLWSFTPEGEFRWFRYNDTMIFNSPAIGLDGSIYSGSLDYVNDLCAFQTNGEIRWCLDIGPGTSSINSVAVGTDGTIYLPMDAELISGLVAINPDGTVKWTFTAAETGFRTTSGIAIAKDGSIRLFLCTYASDGILYSISPEGELLWKKSFITNPLAEGNAYLRWPITIDQSDNTYFCPGNSHCYGVNSVGEVFWDFEFPLVDSIIIQGFQPIIAADGILYIFSTDNTLYAFADSSIFPLLKTSSPTIGQRISVGAPGPHTSIDVFSSAATITFSASLSPAVDWLTLTNPLGQTPASLDLQFNTASLSPGVYTTKIKITPGNPFGVILEIPVNLVVEEPGAQHQYLPTALRSKSPNRKLFFVSEWFNQHHVASIDQNGNYRQPVLQFDPQVQIEDFFFSPDGKKIALRAYIRPDYHLMVMEIESGEVLMDLPISNFWRPISWSPDSRQLVFSSYQQSIERFVVNKINIDGSGLVQLTPNEVTAKNPRWSPAGDKIAMDTGSYSKVTLTVMNPDGSGFRLIESDHVMNTLEGWSPDGSQVILSSHDNIPTDNPIYLGITNISSNTYQQLPVVGYSKSAVWSPDGSKIAYVGFENTYPRQTRVYVIKPDGSGLQCLTPNLDKDVSELAWSTDGQWLSFSVRRDDIHEDPNFDIYVIRSDGSGLTQITTNLQEDRSSFWVP